MKAPIIAIALLALTGCAQQIQAARSAHDEQQCASMGVGPSDPRYYDCRMRLEQMREARRDAAIAAAPGEAAAAAALLNSSGPHTLPASSPTMTCTQMGYQTVCR